MEKILKLVGRDLIYDLQYKNVKNINLRVRPDGIVHVSVNRRVPQRMIDDFLINKSDMIFSALDNFEKHRMPQKKPNYSENKVKNLITEICRKVYPYFEQKGVSFPQIKFRRMVSQWGNCRTDRRILTFNINLMYADYDCIEYVVMHEFTHFLQPNHSGKFYEELMKICPDWKDRKDRLKEISLR